MVIFGETRSQNAGLLGSPGGGLLLEDMLDWARVVYVGARVSET